MAATRRSQRVKPTVAVSAKEPESDTEKLHDKGKASAKRRKVAGPSGMTSGSEISQVVHRGKGKLRNLPQMPLDILFEIFGFLTPFDLLRLARTTKDFRSFIMKRSSISLWKTVFGNTPDVPDQPEGVSEPAWANFVFTNHCFECLSPRASHTLAAHCVRYCKRCITNKVYFKPLSNANVLRHFPRSPIPFQAIFTYNLPCSSGRYRTKSAWLQSEFQEFLEQYIQLDHDAQTEFREIDYNNWDFSRQCIRTGELVRVRATRFDLIEKKLIELGWSHELTTMTASQSNTLKGHPAVKVNRPLTDRTWKKIEPQLIILLEQFRTQRLERERAEIVKTRRRTFASAVWNYTSTQPVDAILPSAADLYFLKSFEPFKNIIEEAPNETDVPLSTFDEFFAEMPRHCEDWKQACVAYLATILRSAEPSLFNEDMSSLDIVSLAKTVSRCKFCSSALTYPGILIHPCFRLAPALISQVPALEVAQIIRACGFDPETATSEELDNADIWLLGTKHGIAEISHVMRWRRALMAISATHEEASLDIYYDDLLDKPYTWYQVTDETLIETCNAGELAFYAEDRLYARSSICAHCSEKVEPGQLVPHMKGLPAEILLQIFTEATTPKHFFEHVSASVALRVCKRWRRVAFNIPSLWPHVDVSNVTTHGLELTGPLPSLLRVTCSKWTTANIRTWSTSVMEVIERIWELDLHNIPSTPIFDALSLHIDRPASDLRVLHAFIKVPSQKRTKGKKTRAKLPPLDQMGRFMDRPMPYLRILELSNFPVLPWSPEKPPCYSNLTTLTLRMWYNSNHANFSQIVPSLKASSTSLTYLSLFNVVPDMGNEVDAGLVKLPFLETLSITTDESDAMLIARLLQIPQKSSVIVSSKDVDLSSIKPEDIIQFYEHICPTAPPVEQGEALFIHVSRNSIMVNGDTLLGLGGYFALSGSSSRTDYSVTLLDLAIRFCSLFKYPRRVEYKFESASMDCDWSAFLRNLEDTRTLAILDTPLTTMRKFMQKSELGSLAPKLNELVITTDLQDDVETDSFESNAAAADALRDIVISFRQHLRRHTDTYNSIMDVGFAAHPFSAYTFLDDFKDSSPEFHWAVEGFSAVEGTRGEASWLKFRLGLGDVSTDEDSDDSLE
ncbi:hypothetical protein ONZ45_g15579 [Pleurotus djamor]|nr:hypothetical protein ONZ45_g15579 [Pleurotus djamor]